MNSHNYAIITGASKGIGKEIATILAAKGYNLILIARSKSSLEEMSIYLNATYNISVEILVKDLSNLEQVQTTIDWINQKKYNITILVNNAGYGLSGYFDDTKLTDNLNMMHLNMDQLVIFTYHLISIFKKKSEQTYILNIASTTSYQAVPGLSTYAATKAFVLNFSRGLAAELKNTNISITAASPGGTNTGFSERANINSSVAINLAKKLNMEATDVARIAVQSMFAQKKEIVIGKLNKLGVFLAWLLPKSFIENSAKKIYLSKD